MSGNSNDNNLYNPDTNLTVRQRAGFKAWATRRANARRRDYRARGLKAWITRRARKNFGTAEQSSVTRRLNELY